MEIFTSCLLMELSIKFILLSSVDPSKVEQWPLSAVEEIESFPMAWQSDPSDLRKQ